MKLCQLEFKLSLDSNVMKFKETLMEFPKDEHLGKLYFATLGVSRFKTLASVVALVLTLSHGQVSVECGFSQNNSLIQVNMPPIQLFLNKLSKIICLQVI